jgi:hypothetical protein
MQSAENGPGEKFQVAGGVDMVEVDQLGDPLRVLRPGLVIHPAVDDVGQRLAVQKTVDPDHRCAS